MSFGRDMRFARDLGSRKEFYFISRRDVGAIFHNVRKHIISHSTQFEYFT